MPPDIRSQTVPPVVGKWYLVPCIFMQRYNDCQAIWWPVHGKRHNDKQFFRLDAEHYHVDQRFLGVRHLDQIGHFEDRHGNGPVDRSFAVPVSAPYSGYRDHEALKNLYKPLDEPQFRRMKCKRVMPKYPFSRMAEIVHLNEHFSGKSCANGRHGWVCPHQHYPLGQETADDDGVITCPLHGLRIDAETGKCMGKAT